jgi:hypothetical protein
MLMLWCHRLSDPEGNGADESNDERPVDSKGKKRDMGITSEVESNVEGGEEGLEPAS